MTACARGSDEPPRPRRNHRRSRPRAAGLVVARAFDDPGGDGGTGGGEETGKGAARGTKLNLPLKPSAGDAAFMEAWEQVEQFAERARPEFILLQCGADSLGGDPIAHLALTREAHRHAATRLCRLADRFCSGRLLALGGGGYNRQNLALAWTAVVQAMIETP